MKRSVHLQPFSHDHHAGLAVSVQLLRGLQEGAGTDALAAEVAALWERELTPHFRREEELLLPLLQETYPRVARRMIGDHEQIAGLVEAVRDGVGDRRAALASFAQALRAHVRFEERVAFPAIERVADAATLARIGAALQ